MLARLASSKKREDAALKPNEKLQHAGAAGNHRRIIGAMSDLLSSRGHFVSARAKHRRGGVLDGHILRAPMHASLARIDCSFVIARGAAIIMARWPSGKWAVMAGIMRRFLLLPASRKKSSNNGTSPIIFFRPGGAINKNNGSPANMALKSINQLASRGAKSLTSYDGLDYGAPRGCGTWRDGVEYSQAGRVVRKRGEAVAVAAV